MFTRAVNLNVCKSLSFEDFLYAIQLHIFEYGIMQTIVSDNQPSFVNGVDWLSRVLSSTEMLFLN